MRRIKLGEREKRDKSTPQVCGGICVNTLWQEGAWDIRGNEGEPIWLELREKKVKGMTLESLEYIFRPGLKFWSVF